MDESEYLRVFKVYDRDFDGLLSPIELHQALGVCGGCPTIKDVEDVLEKEYKTNKIDSQNFITLLKKLRSTNVHTPEKLAPLFKIVDPQGKGDVDTYVIEYLCANFNERLSSAESKEFTNALGAPPGGKIPISSLVQKLAKMQTE